MKVFISAVVVAVVIAAGASIALNSYLQESSTFAYTGSGVRLQ